MHMGREAMMATQGWATTQLWSRLELSVEDGDKARRRRYEKPWSLPPSARHELQTPGSVNFDAGMRKACKCDGRTS